MLNIELIRVTEIEQNCRILWSERTKNAVVVDPGSEPARILRALEERDLSCEQIWVTHSHFDHCGGVAKLKEATQARLFAHKDEAQMRKAVAEYAGLFGMAGEFDNCPEPDNYLAGGETLEGAGFKFNTFHTPGHSPGSICYYSAEAEIVVVGDVLFAGSIGRSDLPGGNQRQLLGSVQHLLEILPGKTRVLSGHGPDTTLDQEKQTNPFLR